MKKPGPDTGELEPTEVVVHAMIECPAGTVTKRAYDPEQGKVEVEKEQGSPERYAYLPFPANYGFIPGTKVRSDDGGDGDPLDVFVLCEALPAGTMLDVDVIGLIRISDEDQINDRLVALPRDRGLRTMDAGSIDELPAGVVRILQQWILHHDAEKPVKVKGVKGPKAGMKAVEKWRTKKAGA